MRRQLESFWLLLQLWWLIFQLWRKTQEMEFMDNKSEEPLVRETLQGLVLKSPGGTKKEHQYWLEECLKTGRTEEEILKERRPADE